MEDIKDRDHQYRSWPVLGLLFVLVALVGCSQSGSKTAAATAGNKCSPKKAATSQASATKKTTSSKKSSAEAELTDEDGLALLAEPNYKDDIAPVFKTKCATSGCHAPGAASPALDSYAAVTTGTAIADSIKRMKDTVSPMPPKPAAAMDSTFIATFETWGKGKPPKESASLTGSKDTDDEDTGKSTSKKTTKVTKKGSEDAEAEEEYVCVKKSQVKGEDEETDGEANAKATKSGSASKTSKSTSADEEE